MGDKKTAQMNMGGTARSEDVTAKTPDDRDVIYVGVPSMESTEAWAINQEAERADRRADRAMGARIRALEAAERGTFKSPDETHEQFVERVLTDARVFAAFIEED